MTDDTEGRVEYSIRVQGRLGPRWATWFAGMTLAAHDDGTTTLRGPLPDQAALHGVLAGLRDLGIPLLSVTTSGTTDPDAEPPASPPSQKGMP